jgi:hypothetical protein
LVGLPVDVDILDYPGRLLLSRLRALAVIVEIAGRPGSPVLTPGAARTILRLQYGRPFEHYRAALKHATYFSPAISR